MVALRLQSVSPWGTHRRLLLLRGIGGALALWLYFWLIHRVPLASAYAIQNLVPIFATLIALLWFKERLHTRQWILYAIALITALFIQRIDARIEWNEWMIGIASVLLIGLTINVMRALRNKEHPLVVIVYFPLVTLPIITPYAVLNWHPPDTLEWLQLLLVGVFTQAAQYLSTKAVFVAEKISQIAIFGYLGIVFAVLFGYLFNETYTWTAYLGMLIITIAVALSTYLRPKKNRA